MTSSWKFWSCRYDIILQMQVFEMIVDKHLAEPNKFHQRPRSMEGRVSFIALGISCAYLKKCLQWYFITIQHNDDVIKWKHFPRYRPLVRGIYRSPVNSPHKGQWCGALMFSLMRAWINGWVNNREAGDLRDHRAHYDVTVMCVYILVTKGI